jgi:hypothetical protein
LPIVCVGFCGRATSAARPTDATAASESAVHDDDDADAIGFDGGACTPFLPFECPFECPFMGREGLLVRGFGAIIAEYRTPGSDSR